MALVLDKTLDGEQMDRVVAAAERFEARHGLRLRPQVGYGREPDAGDFVRAVEAEVAHDKRLGRLWSAVLCRALRVPQDAGITLYRDSGTGMLRVAYDRAW